MTARVFLPHPVMVSTPSGRRWKFPIEGIIRDYGAIITLLDNSDIMLTPGQAIMELESGLKSNKFDPTEDYFLAAGDMTAYAAMLLVALLSFGSTPKQLRHTRTSDKNYDVLQPMRTFELDALLGNFVINSPLTEVTADE